MTHQRPHSHLLQFTFYYLKISSNITFLSHGPLHHVITSLTVTRPERFYIANIMLYGGSGNFLKCSRTTFSPLVLLKLMKRSSNSKGTKNQKHYTNLACDFMGIKDLSLHWEIRCRLSYDIFPQKISYPEGTFSRDTEWVLPEPNMLRSQPICCAHSVGREG
eukprot:SAG11_NODE_15969_length_561_cov_0.755411_1_plen_161_part_10